MNLGHCLNVWYQDGRWLYTDADDVEHECVCDLCGESVTGEAAEAVVAGAVVFCHAQCGLNAGGTCT